MIQPWAAIALALAQPAMEIEEFEPAPPPPATEPGPRPEAPPSEVPLLEVGEEAAAPAEPTPAVEPEPSEASSPSTPDAARARLFGLARGALGVDTSFDSLRGESLAENVADLRARLSAGADVALSPQWRLLLEARARWRGTTQRGLDRAKALFEAELGEAFLDFYSPRIDVRLGQQLFALGANALGAPTDVLNPRDLREGLLAAPEDAKVPVLAARASGELGPVRWLVGYVPFFQPHRYTLFGQDEGFAQPASGQVIPEELHESIEDQLQPHLLETERPEAWPWEGDLAVQLRSDVGPVRLGASWAFVHEKTPQVFLDAELERLLAQSAKDEPSDPATALSVEQRLRAGEKLMRGTYPRQHLVGLEATALIDRSQLDVDLGWSPKQTFVTDGFEPLRRTTFTWAVGLSPAQDEDLIYALSWSGMAIRKVPAHTRLFLLEPATARGRERTAWFHLFAGELGYRLLEGRLEASVRAALEPVVGSFMLQPHLRYELSPRLHLSAWAELWQGKSKSLFGYFARNDQVVAALEADLF